MRNEKFLTCKNASERPAKMQVKGFPVAGKNASDGADFAGFSRMQKCTTSIYLPGPSPRRGISYNPEQEESR